MVSSNLPNGWIKASLDELSKSVSYGFTAKTKDGNSGAKYLRITDIQNGVVDWGQVPYCDCGDIDKYRLAIGDIVVARTGATTGKNFRITEVPVDSVYASYLIRLAPVSVASSRIMSLFMDSDEYWKQIQDKTSGIAQPGVNASKLKSIEFPLPPLNEQRRIADKIDALQAKSRRAREALETAKPLLEKFRQSVLAAAFRGDLTAEWRKQNPDVEPASKLLERIRTERRTRWEEAELAKMQAKGKEPKDDKWKAKYKEPEPVDTSELPELPEGWCWTNLDNLICSIDAGKSPKASSTPANKSEKGVLKVSAVSWGQFNASENKRLPEGYEINGIPTVGTGDLLISRANTVELVGAVVVAHESHSNLILSDKILRLNRASDLTSAPFLKFALRSQWVRDIFEDQATGTSNSMRNLSQGKILSAPIPFPSKIEAELITRLLESTEEKIGSLDEIVLNCEVDLAKLDQSILAKAFRGELVPQDPNDEPASVLLERIKAERQVAKGKRHKR
nr:restriction endonuclease subunit S [Pseudodesulfovibrio sp.]